MLLHAQLTIIFGNIVCSLHEVLRIAFIYYAISCLFVIAPLLWYNDSTLNLNAILLLVLLVSMQVLKLYRSKCFEILVISVCIRTATVLDGCEGTAKSFDPWASWFPIIQMLWLLLVLSGSCTTHSQYCVWYFNKRFSLSHAVQTALKSKKPYEDRLICEVCSKLHCFYFKEQKCMLDM